MKFEIYEDVNNQWRWRLVAENNKIIATSGEGYHNRRDLENILSKIFKHIKADVFTVEFSKD